MGATAAATVAATAAASFAAPPLCPRLMFSCVTREPPGFLPLGFTAGAPASFSAAAATDECGWVSC